MIQFHFEDIPPKSTLEKVNVRQWLEACISKKGFELGDLNYVFASDEYILNMNKEYLEHDYYTDVITFDYTEGGIISGDIFISYDRVKDNAKQMNVTLKKELSRVMAHGMLHLMGYKDKTPVEQEEMSAQEDYCLTLQTF